MVIRWILNWLCKNWLIKVRRFEVNWKRNRDPFFWDTMYCIALLYHYWLPRSRLIFVSFCALLVGLPVSRLLKSCGWFVLKFLKGWPWHKKRSVRFYSGRNLDPRTFSLSLILQRCPALELTTEGDPYGITADITDSPWMFSFNNRGLQSLS